MPDSPYDLADAAIYLGFPSPFALTPAQITAAGELLRRQHPFVRRYTSSVAELEALMRDGRVQVALGPARVAEDVPGVTASVPHDGVAGSVEALAISATGHPSSVRIPLPEATPSLPAHRRHWARPPA